MRTKNLFKNSYLQTIPLQIIYVLKQDFVLNNP